MENQKIKVSDEALCFMKKHKCIKASCEVIASSISPLNDVLIFKTIQKHMKKSVKMETAFWKTIYDDNPHLKGVKLSYNHAEKQVEILSSSVSDIKNMFNLLKSKLIELKRIDLSADVREIELKFNGLKSEE